MVRFFSLSLTWLLLTACEASPAVQSDAGPPPPSCPSTCAARLSECGGPPGGGDPCAMVCAALTTATELACLSSSSCRALADEYERGRIPCDGTAGSDAGVARDAAGGACDPSDPPRCEGNSVVTCEEVAGSPTVVTSACSGGATCEAGECIAPACDPLGTRGCTSGGGDCCAGTVCSFETSDTRCCVPADESEPCAADADCCGHDPSSVLTARCFSTGCRVSL